MFQLTEDASSQMDKRARFAFAKRFAFNGGSRSFAFAKRSGGAPVMDNTDTSAEAFESSEPLGEEKRARFAFAKRFAFNGPTRNFAFAKRSPYSSFA